MLKEWRLRPSAPVESVGGTDIPPIVGQVMRSRGITGSGINSFLNPLSHDPALLPGIEPACLRLHRAIMFGETVGIFGDFDVDGVTGTALVAEGLQALGAKVVPYIPHRVAEGHGPNADAIHFLRERGVSVLVTVDCGITSLKEVALAQDLGVDVIITDHHVEPQTLPPALSIIDPKIEGSEYPFPELSGAGLAFKVIQGLYDLVGQSWDRGLLELAALSTVADLVPLRDENRFLVKEGLKELRRTRRPGLLALYKHAGIKAGAIDVETISFSIAPRLNAAGRLEDAYISYKLLLTQSSEEAERLAAQLGALNKERQRLTEEGWTRVREEVIGWSPLPSILLVEDPGLPLGIAGLVASKLVDEFHRPAVVMSLVDGVIRASARSVPEFDIAGALSECRDLFIRHGGHHQAAGFQMLREDLPELKERLGRVAEEKLGGLDLNPGLDIDAQVPVASLMGKTFRWLKELEPFGVANPTPVFLSRNLQPLEARPVGGQGRHLRLKLKEGGAVWDAMAFRQGDRWAADMPPLDVVYTIGTEWRGSTEVLALKVLDFRPSDG